MRQTMLDGLDNDRVAALESGILFYNIICTSAYFISLILLPV